MELKGYIEYKNEKYTFIYDGKCLNTINCNNMKQTSIFATNPKLDWLEGKTISGYDVAFYIDGNSIEFCNSYKCYPKIVFISKTNRVGVLNLKFDSLKFSGSVINRFYSNAQIFNEEFYKYRETKRIEFKSYEEVTKSEKIAINGSKSELQMSISYPGCKVDGNIKFGDANSIMRIKYGTGKMYKNIIDDILLINDLFFFCMNRRQINYESIVLETKNTSSDKYESIMEIYIPTENEKKYDPKYLITYNTLQGKVGELLKVLSNLKYSTYIIPKDNIEYRSVTAISYSSAFSAYQSTYNYICNVGSKDFNDFELNELKEEVSTSLKLISDKYKGVNAKKRKLVECYISMVNKSNLKLEKMILDGIKMFPFIEDTLLKSEKEIIFGNIESSVIDAVHDRDLITHDDILMPSDADVVIYQIIERIIYAMILKQIGIEKDKIEQTIKNLSVCKII